MQKRPRVPEQYPSLSRVFTVEYFHVDQSLWRTKTRVVDAVYNLIVSLDISVPDFTVRAAQGRFLAYPRAECLRAGERLEQLVGTNVYGNTSSTVRQLFRGQGGCDTLFNLLSMTATAIRYPAFAAQVASGALTSEQFYRAMPEGAVCVAHEVGEAPPFPFLPNDAVGETSPPVQSPTARADGAFDSTTPVRERRISVDYYEVDDELWNVRSHLTDFGHNILVSLDVSTSDLCVRRAGIFFLRQPSPICNHVEERMELLVGSCLATDYRGRIARALVGAEGCGNAFVLLNVIPRGLLQLYLARRAVLGAASAEQEALCRQGLRRDCLVGSVGS